jgi:hypothetical protein
MDYMAVDHNPKPLLLYYTLNQLCHFLCQNATETSAHLQ